jgi:hypothetical protein
MTKFTAPNAESAHHHSRGILPLGVLSGIVKGARLSVAIAVALILLPRETQAAEMVDLGTAADFAILAGSGVTNAGATTIYGDVGSFPTATTAGFGTVTLYGTNHGGDPVTMAAKADLLAAYADAQGQEADTIYPAIFELAELTLVAGVYNNPSSFSLNGTLILDGLNDVDAVWIFQMGSTFTAGANSTVSLINGAQASNVFWQVGSSATLGADVQFAGTMLAQVSISADAGTTVNGRLLAQDGAVTLVNNNVVPEPSSAFLLGGGILVLFCYKRRLFPRVLLARIV